MIRKFRCKIVGKLVPEIRISIYASVFKKNTFVSKKRYSIINDKRDKKRNSFEKSANFKLFTMVENAIGVLDK